MSSQAPLLVFDLDGTLVDSNRDLIPALNHVIALDGVSPVSLDAVGHVVGKGVLEMLNKAYQLAGRRLSDQRRRELLPVYLEYYSTHIADHTVFYEGALASLDDLSSRGWRFAICTNKYEYLARMLLDELGELDRFAAIAGGDTFAFKKPDGRHILETIALAGGSPSRSIMVGDSVNDTAAAQDAGIPVIAVDFGYSDVPVKQLGAQPVISHFDTLAHHAQVLLEAPCGTAS